MKCGDCRKSKKSCSGCKSSSSSSNCSSSSSSSTNCKKKCQFDTTWMDSSSSNCSSSSSSSSCSSSSSSSCDTSSSSSCCKDKCNDCPSSRSYPKCAETPNCPSGPSDVYNNLCVKNDFRAGPQVYYATPDCPSSSDDDSSTLGDILEELNDPDQQVNKPFGARIILLTGQHTLNTSYKFKIPLEIVGNLGIENMGVGYIHGMGQTPDVGSAKFGDDTDDITSITGLGPWSLTVNGNSDTVTVSGSKSPCFNGVLPGDTVNWVDANGGVTSLKVKCASKKSITFSCQIPITTGDNTVKQGEGFSLLPRATISMLKDVVLTSEQDQVHKFIDFDLQSTFTTGSTKNTLTLENSTVRGGNYSLAGKLQTNKPNSYINGRLSANPSHIFDHMFPTTMGPDAIIDCNGNNNSWVRYGIHTKNLVGISGSAKGSAQAQNCDFANCVVGVQASSNSFMGIKGSRFYSCTTGAKAFQQSGISSSGLLSEPLADNVPTFDHCPVAIDIDYNSQGTFDKVTMVGNTTDLIRDTVPFATLNLYPSGSYGLVRYSTVFHTNP